MKKIIIFSDSHNNINYIREILESEKDYDIIFHLGDDYPDMDKCTDLISDKKLYRVPGLFDPGYADLSIPRILEITINNWNFLLVHDLKYALQKTHEADFYLHGHTHQWNLESRWGVYFLNPGHIKKDFDRGNNASYCIMKVDNDCIEIRFKDLQGKTYYKKSITRSEAI